MTDKEILEKQVEALEKLLQIKEAITQAQDARIRQLESDNARLEIQKAFHPAVQQPNYQPMPYQPFKPHFPSVFTNGPCTDGGIHEYDNPWHSTSPQPCKKCGSTFSYTTTYAGSSVEVNGAGLLTTIADIKKKQNV